MIFKSVFSMVLFSRVRFTDSYVIYREMIKESHIIVWFFLINLPAILSGCYFSYPEYPNDWDEQVKIDGEIDTSLEGLYACRGETESGLTDIPNIAHLLFDNNKNQKSIDCNTLSIVKHEPGKLEIMAHRHGSVVISRIFELNKDYFVEDDWIYLKSKYDDMSDSCCIAIGKDKIYLTNSNQGDLVMKSESTAMGLVYFIPVGGGQRIWIKFRRIEPATSERLIAELYDANTTVQEQAVIALRYREDLRAVEPLIDLLKGDNKTLLAEAIWTLGEIGDSRAVEPLIAFLNDESVLVRIKAEQALENLTGKRFGNDVAKWQEWLEHNKDNIK
jgi:hypothetical protein